MEIDRSGALLEEYYRLYLISIDRWAERQHEPRALARFRARRRDPLSKLRAMAETLGKAFVVALAYVDDAPGLRLDHPAGSDRARHPGRDGPGPGRQRPTPATWCSGGRSSSPASLGCTAYHLGESGQSASLAQFKEKFGARPFDYAELRLERLPWTRDRPSDLRSVVKTVLGFRDV